jgi:hypothetical protein
MPPSRPTAPRFSFLLLLILVISFPRSFAQPIQLAATENQNGTITLQSTGRPNDPHILLQGTDVTHISTPVATNTVSATGTALFTITPASPHTFYRILGVPALSTIAEMSPANGESGVSVTRETIVRFTAPLAANTVLTTSNFFAGFGGRKLLSRVDLSTDRKTATLFYLEPIPGSTRIYGVFDSTGILDNSGRPIDPDNDGQPGGILQFTFDTLSTTPVPGTAVIGRVFASEPVGTTSTASQILPRSKLSAFAQTFLPATATGFTNRPLDGVTITVDGAEQTIRATTDAQGRFTLTNTPAGRFFVHIDGRTATNGIPNANLPWTQRGYYPFVGKAWDAVPGRTDNLAGETGEIYLPYIAPNTLQPISPTNETTITFPAATLAAHPELADVQLTVPANDLLSENGTRGGKIGIAPVAPDRLPSPLPRGLMFAVVLTIQTDGAQNFDRPVPVRFPNLPNPTSGKKLAPGDKSVLWSFNHDTGHWEIEGPMTVSPDGELIGSDTGNGVRQPGWHGVGEPDWSPPPPPPPPPCLSFENCLAHCFGTFTACLGGLDDNDPCDDPDPRLRQICRALKIFEKLKCLLELAECAHDCEDPDEDCDHQAPSAVPVRIRNPIHVPVPPIKFPAIQPILSQLDGLYLGRARNAARLTGQSLEVPSTTVSVLTRGLLINLYDEAEALAGGDLLAYLTDYNRAVQDGVANMGPDGGNAPAYPVRYQAVVETSSGNELSLRGETGPFGSYSLFLPRDSQTIEISFYDTRTGKLALNAPTVKAKLRRPYFAIEENALRDQDKDGLPDKAEAVLGTDPYEADTDGDGVLDGAEIREGTDPLEGRPAITGIIASAQTASLAVDISALNNIAAVANGAAGVTLFNVSGQNPLRLAQVDTPGDARRVALSSDYIAVADGPAGLAIIDITDPPNARISQQVNLGGTAGPVTISAGVAYVGVDNRDVAAVDLRSGLELGRIRLDAGIGDLAVAGDYIYAIGGKLQVISFLENGLQLIGSVNVPAGGDRLTVGDNFGYALNRRGFSVIDTADPKHPALVRTASPGQIAWEHLALNGSGLALGAAGVNFNDPADLYLYSLDGAQPEQFLTAIGTPGGTRAISIFNGLAYIAAGSAFDVVNYIAYDSKHIPPAITLSTSLGSNTNAIAEEGQSFRLTASVTDDVQVRNVEFYIDGQKVLTDGNYPFESRFIAPLLNGAKSNFTVRAKATDTGGNSSWSDEILIPLSTDTTEPRLLKRIPDADSIVSVLQSIYARFSEPVASGTITGTSVSITFAGADASLGTPDDVVVPVSNYDYAPESNAAILTLPQAAPAGLYSVTLRPPISDLKGNLLAVTNWTFWYFPTGPGADDDHDGLSNAQEVAAGSNPFLADTDGDGWDDAIELSEGSDPRDPNSGPHIVYIATPSVRIVTAEQSYEDENAVYLAKPPLIIRTADQVGSEDKATYIAKPPLTIAVPQPNGSAPSEGR